MKIQIRLLVVMSALALFSSCHSSNSQNTNQLETIDQTTQFLASTGDQRFKAGGDVFRFGNNGSFEMFLDRKTHLVSSSANCKTRFTGTFSYYAQKATTLADGTQTASSKVLELRLNEFKLLSSKSIYSAPGATSAESICNQYDQNLIAMKSVSLYVSDFASDHLTVEIDQDFGMPNSDSSGIKPNAIWTEQANGLGMGSLFTYYVKEGATFDLTSSFLKVVSDPSYTTDGTWVNSAKGEAALSIDAGLKEMSFEDTRCGLKYWIDITSVTTDGGTPLLRGTIADSEVALPENETDSTGDHIPLAKCVDIQNMIEGVTTQGLRVAGMQNICTDKYCGAFRDELRIGKADADSNYPNSLIMSFESAARNSIREEF